MARKGKKGQTRILNEIRDQLILQAERWDRKEYYTPLKLEDIELEQCKRIRGDFLTEKANLEYEMNLLGTDKREVLIKTERLDTYIKRADQVIKSHEKKITRILDKLVGDKAAVKKAEELIKTKSAISVMIDS